MVAALLARAAGVVTLHVMPSARHAGGVVVGALVRGAGGQLAALLYSASAVFALHVARVGGGGVAGRAVHGVAVLVLVFGVVVVVVVVAVIAVVVAGIITVVIVAVVVAVVVLCSKFVFSTHG